MGGDFGAAVPFTHARGRDRGRWRGRSTCSGAGPAAMEDQRWVKSNVATLTGALQGAATLAEFGERLLSGLVPALGGGVAAFYALEPGETRLRRIAHYGLAESAQSQEWIGLGEGLVGQCAREGKPVRLAGLPAGLPAHLLGPGRGRADAGGGLAARVARGAAGRDRGRLLPRARRAGAGASLEELLPAAALNLQVLQRNLRTQELLVQTRDQAEELEAQQKSLRRSTEELSRQFLADSALELTKAGYWHVPLDGSGWYNSSERAVRIFGDLPEPRPPLSPRRVGRARPRGRRGRGQGSPWRTSPPRSPATIPGLRRDLRLQAAGGRARRLDPRARARGQGRRAASRPTCSASPRTSPTFKHARARSWCGAAAEGRGSHPDEVDVPRQHEPRDPHADERDHRPLAPGPEDRAHAQAARLRGQDPQRGHVAAHRDQRHPGLLQDRGGPARHRVHPLHARPGDPAGGGGHRAEGAREGAGVPGGRPRRDPPEPGGRSRCAWARS